MVYSNSSV